MDERSLAQLLARPAGEPTLPHCTELRCTALRCTAMHSRPDAAACMLRTLACTHDGAGERGVRKSGESSRARHRLGCRSRRGRAEARIGRCRRAAPLDSGGAGARRPHVCTVRPATLSPRANAEPVSQPSIPAVPELQWSIDAAHRGLIGTTRRSGSASSPSCARRYLTPTPRQRPSRRSAPRTPSRSRFSRPLRRPRANRNPPHLLRCTYLPRAAT